MLPSGRASLSLSGAGERLVAVPDVAVDLPGAVGLAFVDREPLAAVLGGLTAGLRGQRECVGAPHKGPVAGYF